MFSEVNNFSPHPTISRLLESQFLTLFQSEAEQSSKETLNAIHAESNDIYLDEDISVGYFLNFTNHGLNDIRDDSSNQGLADGKCSEDEPDLPRLGSRSRLSSSSSMEITKPAELKNLTQEEKKIGLRGLSRELEKMLQRSSITRTEDIRMQSSLPSAERLEKSRWINPPPL